MLGRIKVMTRLTGKLTEPCCNCDPNHGGQTADGGHIMADLASMRDILITSSKVYDFTTVENFLENNLKEALL